MCIGIPNEGRVYEPENDSLLFRIQIIQIFQCCRLVSCQGCCSLCTDLENLKFKTFEESRTLLSNCVHAMTSSNEWKFFDFGYLYIKEKLSLKIFFLSLNLKKKY